MSQNPSTPPQNSAFSFRPFALTVNRVDQEPSPAHSSGSTLESGTHNVFDSPEPKGKRRDTGDVVENSAPSTPGSELSHDGEPESDDKGDKPSSPNRIAGDARPEDQSRENKVPENPFDNEHSRILFRAIDNLQTWGSSKYIEIPQLVIVGSQSSGKSSLLQTLTNIPFPVGTGTCTRFPTRIVSYRTAPGTRDYLKVTVEKPRKKIPGLKPADEKAYGYKFEGDTIDAGILSDVITDVRKNYMGIRAGKGDDMKNFVADILKIELSGPNRSNFGILDLPGIFSSEISCSEEEMHGVKEMVIDYMKQPENIVICIADAYNDLDVQEIFMLSLKHVDKKRLVGVLTKCDLNGVNPNRISALASGHNDDKKEAMHNGWFVVRNRRDNSETSLDVSVEENKLFSANPWTNIPSNRRGSPALRTHLGELLSTRIRAAFPAINANIQAQLSKRVTELTALGGSRENHSARQQYLMGFVQKYAEKVKLALGRPGFLNSHDMELRRVVKELSCEFDTFMRDHGHVWEFQDEDIDPGVRLDEMLRSPSTSHSPKTKESSASSAAFVDYLPTKDFESLKKEIHQHLSIFQATQLPGVVNPDIYPAIHTKQTEKWTPITVRHLERISDAIRRCFEEILKSVCPPTGATEILYQGLMEVITHMFMEINKEAYRRALAYCGQETQCLLLQTTNPCFAKEVLHWKQLRYWTRTKKFHKMASENPQLSGEEKFFIGFNLTDPNVEDNMTEDIHDVLKVYYKLSRESFIRHITSIIVEELISHSNGPLNGLNMNYIMSLSEGEVEYLAREDDSTTKRRVELKEDIRKLEGARAIVEEAREQTRGLGLA